MEMCSAANHSPLLCIRGFRGEQITGEGCSHFVHFQSILNVQILLYIEYASGSLKSFYRESRSGLLIGCEMGQKWRLRGKCVVKVIYDGIGPSGK